jgi:YesN/AraC family two-component response regulator
MVLDAKFPDKFLFKPMRDAGIYVELVEIAKQELKPDMSKQERKKALQRVVKRCIDKGILKEFLEANAEEVQKMLFTEWNWDDYKTVMREEAGELDRIARFEAPCAANAPKFQILVISVAPLGNLY